MAVGPHVFEDGRFGCWIVNPSRLQARAPALRALGVSDVFLRGPDGNATTKAWAIAAPPNGGGFVGCHAWWAVDGLTVTAYAARVLADVARWKPGAGDLNIELANDVALEPFIRGVVTAIRAQRPAYNLRVNLAARKGGFLPIDLLQSDEHLYACEQVAGDVPGLNMALRYSEADAIDRLIAAGVPREKASVCYAGAFRHGTASSFTSWPGLPDGFRPVRGVVFQDDLLAEVGAIPA